MKTWLVDTEPVVAYLDAGDPAHADVAACWDAFRGQLVTTSAVITEAMHFVSMSPSGARYLTLDRRGFSTYRTRKRNAFRLALDFA